MSYRVRISMALRFCFFIVSMFFFAPGLFAGQTAPAQDPSSQDPPYGSETKACLNCHAKHTPGIVEDWLSSRHAMETPARGMRKPSLEKRLSAERIDEKLKDKAVGCYECHSLNASSHPDNFTHMGYRINVIVTPNDCRTCHPAESGQFQNSKKAYAHKNLMGNPVYHTLVESITGVKEFQKGRLVSARPSEATLHETCLGCHGTVVEANGVVTIQSKIGPIEVPRLTNWPNQGVGRVNPDGSRGTCTACHARHAFSIEMARKPYTCSQCHLEPDVPAWNVYDESKHGDIFFSSQREWNFKKVPWTVGRDFKSPTCSTCHNSLLVSPNGDVIAERSHDFGSRLWVRIFGLIYSHSQPKSGDTTIIQNNEGLPLPTSLSGQPAHAYLIGKEESTERIAKMRSVCLSCHSTNWTDSHFRKFDNTLRELDKMTLSATNIASASWKCGTEHGKNPFDESIEQMWVKQWLFYANSIRYASAMTGAPDYTAFKNGWWYLTETLQNMADRLELKKKLGEESRKCE